MPLPAKTCSARLLWASRAGGTTHDAPASIAIDQIATSDSSLAAHEWGGGASGCASASAPAMTVTSTPENWRRGMSLSQSIVKYGAAILLFAGKFSQI